MHELSFALSATRHNSMGLDSKQHVRLSQCMSLCSHLHVTLTQCTVHASLSSDQMQGIHGPCEAYNASGVVTVAIPNSL